MYMYMYICTCVHVYFGSMLLYNSMSVFSKCVYTGVQRSMYMYMYMYFQVHVRIGTMH